MVVSWHMHDSVHGEVTIKGFFWGLIVLKKFMGWLLIARPTHENKVEKHVNLIQDKCNHRDRSGS